MRKIIIQLILNSYRKISSYKIREDDSFSLKKLIVDDNPYQKYGLAAAGGTVVSFASIYAVISSSRACDYAAVGVHSERLSFEHCSNVRHSFSQSDCKYLTDGQVCRCVSKPVMLVTSSWQCAEATSRVAPFAFIYASFLSHMHSHAAGVAWAF